MSRRKMQKPVLGCAFDPDHMNEPGRIEAYISELQHYRPRKFATLRKEGKALLRKYNQGEDWDWSREWSEKCDMLLSEHAQRYGMEYVSYGPFEHGGAIGYMVNPQSAIEDADHIVNDRRNGRNDGDIPRGFTGLYVHINDHGNVSAYRYVRGKSRELWSVV